MAVERSAEASAGAPSIDMARMAEQLPRLLRPLARLMPELSYYTVVSALALGLDLVVFTALTRGGLRAALAGIIGYAVGLVLHYILSSRFVFDTTGSTKSGLRRFAEFVVSGGVGILITWAIIAFSTEVLHVPALIGKILAVGTSFIVVFLLRRGIVFGEHRMARG
jgi:putative flippase GtrA